MNESDFLLLAFHSLRHSLRDILHRDTMLASLLAPYITGRYDVTVIPISLPTPLVTILLPSIWSDGQPIFLNQTELEQAGLGQVPSAGEGRNWAIVQIGKQISTGVGFGPGRKTF